MIWDVLNAQSNTYVEALFKLYSLRWEPGNSRAKQTFLLTAILFVTEPIDSREPARRDEAAIPPMLAKIPQLLETIQATRNTFQARE